MDDFAACLLTAVRVSEYLKLPLYRLGAGDLGQTASAVTYALQNALDLCAMWNAVLLIDEADVFLEQRSNDQLQRNELVSGRQSRIFIALKDTLIGFTTVFLTLLEYYRGVLILTTNRPTILDAAFASRIDIILNYQALDATARETIWTNFLKTFPADMVDISAADVKQLSMKKLNGREIKSSVKTARLLAAREKTPIRIKHLDIVLELRERGSKV